MRLCRYQHNGDIEVAFYFDDKIVNVNRTAEELNIRLPAASLNLLDYLPPEGKNAQMAQRVLDAYSKLPAADQRRLSRPMKEVQLRVPIANPPKLILLAGNYAAHIREGGGEAPERQDTYPYYFIKPTTALAHPGQAIQIPQVSPDHIDWEIEMGAVIGRRCKHVSEGEALRYVAGYTVCNDISDRRFQINPKRKPRARDSYHDWLHGKWHDTFLPVGPCITSAAAMPDPQKQRLVLKVNGKVMQDANSSQMIFPIAALVSILSSFVTLEPGDIIVTGTPSGVGHARKPPVYLKANDVVDAEIEGIGVLRNPVALEKA